MIKELRTGFGLFVLLSLLTGLAYPMSVLGLAQTLFPTEANGSLIAVDGKNIGSALIGQTFTSDIYFHGRPSAAGAGYDANNSSGSNLAPTSAVLIQNIKERIAALNTGSPSGAALIPSDLVTASASGLDPHISISSAMLQVSRVANARHLPIWQISNLIREATEGKSLGMLGESRVNVLKLNRALDVTAPMNR